MHKGREFFLQLELIKRPLSLFCGFCEKQDLWSGSRNNRFCGERAMSTGSTYKGEIFPADKTLHVVLLLANFDKLCGQ